MAGEAHERTLSVFAGHFDIGGALLEGASLGRGRESARRYQGCLTKAGSLRFACAMNFLEGRKYCSSFQWTAIWASVILCFDLDGLASFFPRTLATAATPFGSSEFGYDATARDKMMLPRRRASQSAREHDRNCDT